MASTNYLLNTDQNIQKQYINIVQSFIIPSDFIYHTFTVDHNLGYIPSVRAWYSPVSGRWYPLAMTQLADGTGNDFLQCTGTYALSKQSALIELINFTDSPISVPILVRIYLDD